MGAVHNSGNLVAILISYDCIGSVPILFVRLYSQARLVGPVLGVGADDVLIYMDDCFQVVLISWEPTQVPAKDPRRMPTTRTLGWSCS